MAVASCNKRAGTRLGTTEVTAGAERQKQDVKIVAAVVVILKVFLATSPSLVRFALKKKNVSREFFSNIQI